MGKFFILLDNLIQMLGTGLAYFCMVIFILCTIYALLEFNVMYIMVGVAGTLFFYWLNRNGKNKKSNK